MTSNKPVQIIAEAGVNHNGKLQLAFELIDVAAKAGADVVKFQTFTPEKVISRFAPKAEYQKTTTGSQESQLDMVRKLKLSTEDHFKLIEHCKKRGVEFMSSPFDLDAIDTLVKELRLGTIKIPSGEITNAPYLVKLARLGVKLIMSTGMSTLQDVETALGILAFGYTASATEKPSVQAFKTAYASAAGKRALQEKVSILHCTTEYPAPYQDVNLRAMDTLAKTFGLTVGLSDHTPGIAVPVAAVARGARIIEKHFTLDKKMEGPDHLASLNPDELTDMVCAIRQVEQALGSEIKSPSPSEQKNIAIARKSLVAARAIKKGELLTEDNLTIKRPGDGVSALHFWDYLGKPASRDYQEDELI